MEQFARTHKNYVLFPIFLLLAGFCREVLFQSSSILSQQSSSLSVYSVILLYGGLGVLLAMAANRLGQSNVSKATTDSAASLQSLGLLAAGMAHNFRNYLSILQGTSCIIERSMDNRKSVSSALKIQSKCFEQAKGAIDQVLGEIRKGVEQGKKLRPIHDVLEDAIQLAEILVESDKVKVIRDFQSSNPHVQINDIALMQSVINLIKNAAEASDSNSKIIVSTGFVTKGAKKLFAISFKDTGLGMTPEVVENIFRPLCSTKPGGTGLGLVTVKQLVEREGGAIEISSNVNSGTEISLRYPVCSLGLT